MNNLGQIHCFLKVAEWGSFSKAATQLHVTPTAVSKQIKNLEASISEQLFIRTTRSVKLTEFGENFYQRCKVLDENLENIQQFIESKKEIPQGKLKVLVSTILSKSFVLDHLAKFIEAYPKIKLELIFSEEDLDLTRDDIDIMVGFPLINTVTDNLKYRKMYEANNILCASSDFVKRYGIPKNSDDLLNLKFITHTLRKPGNRLPLADGTSLPCATPILYMNNFEALNQACLAGIGIFLSADILVKDWLANGKLVQLLPKYKFRRYEIFIFYRLYQYELPKIRAFVDFYSGI